MQHVFVRYLLICYVQVMKKRFKYDEFEIDHAVARKKQRLDAEAFNPDPDRDSISFKGISGFSAKPPYYTCLPSELGKPGADLAVLRKVHSTGDLVCLQHLHLGLFCNQRKDLFGGAHRKQ